MTGAPLSLSRRRVLAGTGALLVGFALPRPAGAAEGEAAGATGPNTALPGSLKKTPLLDSWIRLEASGHVTVMTGKAELGQGIKTALAQLAAEELDLPLGLVHLQSADTGTTPDEGYTAGSHSVQDSGSAIRAAAAAVRLILQGEAARRLGLRPDQLRFERGAVIGPDGTRLPYGALVDAEAIHVPAAPDVPLKPPGTYRLVNRPVARLDIPAKVTGGAAYVQDMRPPGMLHARVIRPPRYGAHLEALDEGAARATPGFVALVRDGDFLAVVCENEWPAIQAMRHLAAGASWSAGTALPAPEVPAATMLRQSVTEDTTILQRRGAAPPAGLRRLSATYTRPYQAHGSVGPSCAVAHQDGGLLTVWTHTQGVFPDREAIAEMLHLAPEQVRCIHAEGSGCYGHNGADDAAADAALIARAVPGRPIRLQLMREQDAAWEPFGPAMATEVSASLGPDGRVADWTYGVWSNTHNMRPGGAGALLAAQLLATPFAPPPPKPIPQPEGGGDRNAIPLYAFPNATVVHHFVPAMPLRVSAMRALGAYANVFSIESFVDELAHAAGTDPVAFRLLHLDDARASAVVTEAATRFGWGGPRAPGRGHGFAFARYKNLAAYCALATEVEVDATTGRIRLLRAVAAVDAGQVVNPDGLRNQVEGAILQSMSWTLFERVAHGRDAIQSVDWSTYPILRFDGVPDSVAVHLMDRPGLPFLGAGECGQGPTGAAIANAVFDATGQRLRDLPLSPDKLVAALGA